MHRSLVKTMHAWKRIVAESTVTDAERQVAAILQVNPAGPLGRRIVHRAMKFA